MRYRTLTAVGKPCCAVNHIEHLCARCRAQVRTQARATLATTPSQPPPPTPRAMASIDGLTAAELFRATIYTGWHTRRAEVTR